MFMPGVVANATTPGMNRTHNSDMLQRTLPQMHSFLLTFYQLITFYHMIL